MDREGPVFTHCDLDTMAVIWWGIATIEYLRTSTVLARNPSIAFFTRGFVQHLGPS